MGKKLIGDLFKEQEKKATEITLPGVESPLDHKYITANVEFMKALMTTTPESKPEMSINLKEALYAPDASILFPKVISDVLMRPMEDPVMAGQLRLAKVVNIPDGVRSVEFPTVGALRAYDIAPGQEYQENTLAFAEAMTEVKVGKSGLKCPIPEEVINDSMWDILALHVEAMGFAMARWKEEKIFNAVKDRAVVAFDNSIAGAANQTTGKDTNQKSNGSLAFMDLIDAMALQLANGFITTDLVVHPLGWTIFMKDPRLQYQLLTNGPIGQSYAPMGPDNIQANLPWGITVNVSPFMPFTQSPTLTTVTTTGDSSAAATDIYLIDRNNGIVILQREGIQTDEFNDPNRDLRYLKIKEVYGVDLLNAGKAAVAIKNVRITENSTPLYSVRSVS